MKEPPVFGQYHIDARLKRRNSLHPFEHAPRIDQTVRRWMQNIAND